MVLRSTMPKRLLPVEPWHCTKDPWKYPRPIPSNLLRVNKSISALARSIVRNEVYLVIYVGADDGLESSVIRFLNQRVRAGFRSPQTLAHVQHFKQMRNFELDLEPDLTHPWSFMQNMHEEDLGIPWDYQCDIHKEQIRLICDTLETFKDDIQHLIIRIPCLCSLDSIPTTEVAHLAETMLLDIFAPLRRLRVAKPITFRIKHGESECDLYDIEQRSWLPRRVSPYNKARTAHLKQILESNLGRLVGENLSNQEQTWKAIKAMDYLRLFPPRGKALVDLYFLWKRLNRCPDEFEADAERVRDFLCTQLPREEFQKQWRETVHGEIERCLVADLDSWTHP